MVIGASTTVKEELRVVGDWWLVIGERPTRFSPTTNH
jgi:hypothetical protein